MGSSIPHLQAHWLTVAVVFGVFYLIFDALRSFALQLSPVRLRRLSTTSDENRSPWMHFDVEDFQLVSGALLQVSLVIGVSATTLIYDVPTGAAVLRDGVIWGAVVLLWKFVLALIPEDTGEILLRALVPFSRIS